MSRPRRRARSSRRRDASRRWWLPGIGVGLLLIGGLLWHGATPTVPVRLTILHDPGCQLSRTAPAADCSPLPLAGAEVTVVDARGHATTYYSSADGTILFSVPVGTYAITPQVRATLGASAPAFELPVPERGVARTIIYRSRDR